MGLLNFENIINLQTSINYVIPLNNERCSNLTTLKEYLSSYENIHNSKEK